jgi:deoxycytidine triphosphate deaminase
MALLAYDQLSARKDEIFENQSYSEECFQAVSYDLRVSDSEALIDGHYFDSRSNASQGKGLISIPPGQIAFLSTVEVLSMPTDLVGKIGLRFEYARKGLIPLFGPQVDPLYHGRLYFPVFNPGEKDIVFKPRDPLFNIEFHTIRSDAGTLRSPKSFESLPSDIIEEWRNRRMMNLYARSETIEQHIQVQTSALEKKINDMEKRLDAVLATYQNVLWFGIFLIATTILGAILQTIFALFNSSLQFAATNTSIQSFLVAVCVPIVPLGTFLVGLLIVLLVIRPYFKHIIGP